MTMNVKYINSSTLDLHQNESYCMKTLLYIQLFDDVLTTAEIDIKSCVRMNTKYTRRSFCSYYFRLLTYPPSVYKYLVQGCTNNGALIAMATEFCNSF
jgi:hypothetical protein